MNSPSIEVLRDKRVILIRFMDIGFEMCELRVSVLGKVN